jgi:hypothetical protein
MLGACSVVEESVYYIFLGCFPVLHFEKKISGSFTLNTYLSPLPRTHKGGGGEDDSNTDDMSLKRVFSTQANKFSLLQNEENHEYTSLKYCEECL